MRKPAFNSTDNLDQIGKLPQFTPPSKHAAGRVGKKRPKRRNRRKP